VIDSSRFDDAEREETTLRFEEIRRRSLDPGSTELTKISKQISPNARPGLGVLLDDIVLLKTVDKEIQPRLFCGKNCTTQLHYHYCTEAILCPVVGMKRVFLFQPADIGRIYLKRWYRMYFNVSRLNFEFDSTDFDVDMYPKMKSLDVIQVDLHPGDALYIPIYWAHLVFGYDLNIAIAQFWKASVLRRFSNPLVFRRRYLPRWEVVR
jgi:hypothetical protein